MRLFKSIFIIINYKTFIVTILAVASTILCREYGLQADFPLTVIGIAIVFPVVFSIDSAYKRRERALELLSDLKAHMQATYMATRDWIEPQNVELTRQIKAHLLNIFDSVQNYCSQKSAPDKPVFDTISNLSVFIQQEFRKIDMHPGELSRVNQYLSKMMIDVENLKVIHQYRTPITLRAYSRVFIYTFPIIYGPYFVHAAQEYSAGLEFFMPIIFTFILVSLDNIQEHLENPYDQIGEDDIKFDIESFSSLLK